MSQADHFIAVDLGASSGRVLLGQWGEERCALRELHRFANRPVAVAGHLHWDILSLWAEIKAGLMRYAAEYREPLAGIGIDTWGVDFGLLDSTGRLLGNPYHYRDCRVDGILQRACERVTPRRIFNETGVQLMEVNTLYQVFSMAESRDPQLGMAETLLMIPDLLNYWLSGRMACERTNASTSQMFAYHGRSWAEAMLADLGIPAHFLPPVVEPGTVLGGVQPDVMREAGLRNGAPVIAVGTHDTASAVAGVPDLGPASAYISSGTWSLVGVETDQPVISDRVLALNFGNEHGVAGTIRLLKNVTGMWLLQENRRQWEREGYDCGWEELLQRAEQSESFASLIDPDDAGFRHPVDMPSAIRSYCRGSGQPEPADRGEVMRCCLDSLALRYRQVMNSLEDLTGQPIETIRIVGGGSQNRLLCQLTADVCRRPVVAGPVEATAYGNLILQAMATGRVADLAAGRKVIAASAERQYYEPRPEAGCEEAFARYCQLRPEAIDAP